MMYADTHLGRVEAAPGLTGTCPSCGHPCRPRCGRININHWAHHARADCDPWSESMTEWHWQWQQAVPPERREVIMGEHRADIVTVSGGVVEIQHSSISAEQIEARETFYGESMLWIFDATDAFRCGRIVIAHRAGEWDHFRWSHGRRSIAACTRPVLLDLGKGLVARLHMINKDLYCWCRPVTRESVERWMREGSSWDVRRAAPKPPRRDRRRCGCGEVHGSQDGGDHR